MLPGTSTTTSNSPTSFTSLPPEIRSKIYRLALRNLLSTLHVASPYAHLVPRPQYLGALALLHTNRAIREECARELIPIVQIHCQSLDIHIRKLEAAIPASDVFASSPLRVQQRERREAEIRRAELRGVALGNVKSVLWRVVLALPVVDQVSS